jgi:thiol:disulfide interchange protein DsbG
MTRAKYSLIARLGVALITLSSAPFSWSTNDASGLSDASPAQDPSKGVALSLPADASFTTVAGRLANVTLPQSIQSLVFRGYSVGNVFKGGAPGLTGWLLQRSGQSFPLVVYTVEGHGDIYIQGVVRSAEGADLTTTQLRAASYPIHEKRSNLWEVLEKDAAWVATGPSDKERKAVVYVTYTATSCASCSEVRAALRPYEKAGLQVRWVLFSRATNDGAIAAHILSQEDPEAALREQLDNPVDPKSLQGQPTSATVLKVSETTRILSSYLIPAPPILIFKDRTGKTFTIPAEAALPRLAAITKVSP